MFQSKPPKQFWCYAVSHAVFLINRVSTPLLGHKTHYQLLYDSLPDLKLFKVFGSLCYASNLLSHRSKLDPRARKCCFLGYKSGFKGFVLFDLHSREIFISRNVVFHDHILPYPSSSEKNLEYFPFSHLQSSDSSHVPLESSSSPSPFPSVDSPIGPPQRISSRSKHALPHLKDYICQSSSSSSFNNIKNVPYPISHFLSYNKLSNDHLHFALSLTTHTEPKSYAEASKFDCWNKAMETELTALEQTGIWKLVDLPPNIKPIGCRWVYKTTHHADCNALFYLFNYLIEFRVFLNNLFDLW